MRVLIFTILFSVVCGATYASQNQKQLKLRIQAPTGYLDEATIYFDNGVNATFATQEDQKKAFVFYTGTPTIYSLSSDNVALMDNGFGNLSNSEIVPVGVIVDSDGVYKLSASLIDRFDATSIITLEDRQNNTFTDLRTNFVQTNILATEPAAGRFFIHVTTPTVTSIVSSGCANNDGKITVKTDTAVSWDLVQLYDINNNLISSSTNVSGTFDFSLLVSGDYYLMFVDGTYTTTKQFHVNTNQLTASISVQNVTAYTTQDIQFYSNVNNANFYQWDMGDGSMITGVANPAYAYFTPGEYTVTLRCSNSFGCSATATAQVEVAALSGINNVDADKLQVSISGKNVVVSTNTSSEKGSLSVYNLIGQPVYNGAINSAVTTVSLENQPAGVYVVSANIDGKLSTRKIQLSN